MASGTGSPTNMFNMKKLLFAALLFSAGSAAAQKVENITVKGSDISGFISKEVYRYPDFKKAKVYFKNADSAGGRMNYNYLLQTMQFISPQKDTLAVADESSIKSIAIGLDSFFYDNGFYEWVASNSKTRLAIKHSLKLLAGTQKVGAYGIASSTGGIQSQDAFRGFIGTAGLDINEVYQFVKETQYYISVGNKHFVEFNKKNLEDLFPKKEDKIDEYIKTNKVNFNKEQDVVDLFVFVNQQ